MNSIAIDADTTVIAGWFENAKPDLFNWGYLNESLTDIIKNKIANEFDPTQLEQLDNLSEPLKTEVNKRWIYAGDPGDTIRLQAPVVLCKKPQKETIQNIISTIAEHSFGTDINIIPTNMNRRHIHQNKYKSIVHESIRITAHQLCIPVKGFIATVFDAMYDPVKTENSIEKTVGAFLRDMGVRSIQPTKNTTDEGKYLLIIQADKENNLRNKVHQMCEDLKVDHPELVQECSETFGYYPFVNDRITTENNIHNLAQRYLRNQNYNNYDEKPLQPNANPIQIHQRGGPPIERITFQKSYAAVLRSSNGNDTNNDSMSISSAKHGPVSTTSPITGGSPKSNKSEITELKTEISDLHTHITGFQTLMTNMHEESKAREERDRQDKLERERSEKEKSKRREKRKIENSK